MDELFLRITKARADIWIVGYGWQRMEDGDQVNVPGGHFEWDEPAKPLHTITELVLITVGIVIVMGGFCSARWLGIL